MALELRQMVVVTTGATWKHISSSQIITTNKPTPSFFTGRMAYLSPNQQYQSTEGKIRNTEYGWHVCSTYDSVPWTRLDGQQEGHPVCFNNVPMTLLWKFIGGCGLTWNNLWRYRLVKQSGKQRVCVYQNCCWDITSIPEKHVTKVD